MAKRLLFIDVAKGSAILGVILVHALIHGVWFFPSYALEALPTWLLAILSPLVILATWAGFFELMSGLSNGYNMYDRMVVRDQDFKTAAQGPLVNSTGLLIMHFIYVIFFSHRRNAPYPDVGTGEINTMISGSFELGRFQLTDFQFFYFADVLGSIALAGYLSVGLIYVLHRFDLLYNIEKAWKVIFAASILFFVISYPLWDLGNAMVVDLLQDASIGALILALPLSMLSGAFQPFFPIAGFGLMGVLLGILLSVRNHKEDEPDFYQGQNIPSAKSFLKRFAPLFLLGFFVLFAMYILNGNPALGILEYYRLPPALLSLNMALMFWIIHLAIALFEDPDEETRRRRSEKTTFIRRFGMVTLSVYMFESVINGIVSYQFHKVYDDPTTPDVYESHVVVLPIIAYLIIVFSFWFTFVYFWEKVGFKYGIEYWIIRIGGKFRRTKSAKLDIDKVLKNPVSSDKTSDTSMTPVSELKIQEVAED